MSKWKKNSWVKKTYFVKTSPWRESGLFIWRNIKYLPLNVIYAQLVSQVGQEVLEKRFSVAHSVFSLWKHVASRKRVHLNKVELSLPEDALCPVFLKLVLMTKINYFDIIFLGEKVSFFILCATHGSALYSKLAKISDFTNSQ